MTHTYVHGSLGTTAEAAAQQCSTASNTYQQRFQCSHRSFVQALRFVRRSGSVVDAAPCAGWHQRQSVITHSWLGVTRRANRGHTTEACTRSRACWRVALRRVRHCTPPAAHTNRSDCEARTCCRHCRLADSPGMWHACTHVARTWHAHTSQQQAQTVLVARHAVECSLQAAQPLHHGCDIRPGHLGPGRRLQRGLRRACQRCVYNIYARRHTSPASIKTQNKHGLGHVQTTNPPSSSPS